MVSSISSSAYNPLLIGASTLPNARGAAANALLQSSTPDSSGLFETIAGTATSSPSDTLFNIVNNSAATASQAAAQTNGVGSILSLFA